MRTKQLVYYSLCLQDAQRVVLAEKPTIEGVSMRLDPELRDELLKQLSTLSSVYHKLPHTFVKRRRAAVDALSDLEAKRNANGEEGVSGAMEGGGSGGAGETGSTLAAAPGPSDAAGNASEPTAMDLLGGGDESVRCQVLACHWRHLV